MHYWGDEWFEKYGSELYSAITFIEKRLCRHRIFVCGKEKWGCYRDDFLHLWDGSIGDVFIGYRPTYREWYEKLFYYIDKHLIPYKKTQFGWLYCGLSDFNRAIGLVKLVQKWQAYQYNKTFQLACKKWPNIVDELICDIGGYKMIKPCKWGNVDGVVIHNKYWTKL